MRVSGPEEEGLRIRDDQDWIRINAAFCYTALNRYPEAAAQWRVLVERNDKTEYTYYYGLSLIRQWRLKEGWSRVRQAAARGYSPAQRLLVRARIN